MTLHVAASVWPGCMRVCCLVGSDEGASENGTNDDDGANAVDLARAVLAITLLCWTLPEPGQILAEYLEGPIKQSKDLLQQCQKAVMRELPRCQAPSSVLRFMADWYDHSARILCGTQGGRQANLTLPTVS